MWWKYLIFHYFSQVISDCCFLRPSFGLWKQTFSFWYHYLPSERVKTWKFYISVHFVRKQSKSQKFRLLPTPSTITTVVGDTSVTGTIYGCWWQRRSTIVSDNNDPWSTFLQFTIVIVVEFERSVIDVFAVYDRDRCWVWTIRDRWKERSVVTIHGLRSWSTVAISDLRSLKKKGLAL